LKPVAVVAAGVAVAVAVVDVVLRLVAAAQRQPRPAAFLPMVRALRSFRTTTSPFVRFEMMAAHNPASAEMVGSPRLRS
jgi:hypothetical protein